MKVAASQFYCDESGCPNTFVTTAKDGADAYLDLVDAGWFVKRSIVSAWKHYCPDHRDAAS